MTRQGMRDHRPSPLTSGISSGLSLPIHRVVCLPVDTLVPKYRHMQPGLLHSLIRFYFASTNGGLIFVL